MTRSFLAYAISLLSGIMLVGSAAYGSERVVLENGAFRLELSGEGYALSLWDKLCGQECLDIVKGSVPFCTLTQDRPYDNENFLMYPAKPKVFPSNKISYDGKCLFVEFENTNDIAVIGVDVRDDYIAFNLNRIDYRMESIGVKRRTEIDELAFLQLPVKRRSHFGEWLNVTWDECSGVCVLGTSEKTRIDSYSDRAGLVMWAGSDADVALNGVGSALVVASGERMLDVIEEVERDYNLPRGVESRRCAQYPYSYYELRDVTTSNIDEHISYALKGGFKTMVVYYPDFAHTCGTFLWNERYPNGMEDLKIITSKISKAGLIPGFHIHYSKVSIDDPYICGGVPDPRMNYPIELLMDEDITASDTDIKVDGFVKGLYTEEGRRIVRIDDELIEYASFTEERPYYLKGCKRGVLGTSKASHKSGSPIRLLDVDTWPRFVRVDQNTGIQDEISWNLADIYREAGFKFVYFDGAEDVPQPYWYNVSRAQLSVYEKLDPKPLFSEGALKSHFGWHILTRGNAFDLFRPEQIRTAMQKYTLPCARRIYDDFTSVNFGWVDYLAPSEETMGMQPDMYEYICSKALAWDSPISLMGKLDQIRSHPRTEDNFQVIRDWENVKLANSLSATQKEMLKDPQREFVLLKGADGSPVLYEYRPFLETESVRAFYFERDGKGCLIYWAPGLKEDGWLTLSSAAKSAGLKVFDMDGKSVRCRTKGDAISVPLGKRRIMETNLSESELASLFRKEKNKQN